MKFRKVKSKVKQINQNLHPLVALSFQVIFQCPNSILPPSGIYPKSKKSNTENLRTARIKLVVVLLVLLLQTCPVFCLYCKISQMNNYGNVFPNQEFWQG